MNPLSHVSEFAIKGQWLFGTTGAIGSGVLTFLSDNYYAFGVLGILGGLAVGAHGAYWLWQIKKIEKKNKLIEQELKLLELARRRAEQAQ